MNSLEQVGRTDGTAHDGKYELHLDALHDYNVLIAGLWNYVENNPFYTNETSLFKC